MVKVLIVDDEENVRSSFKRLFRRLGSTDYALVEAGSGKEAMDVLDREAVDCVLMDYWMPGGDGIEWLKKMLEKDKERLVIMLTGEGNEQIAVDAMKTGAMDYLVKGSLRIEDLERAILNAVERVRLRKAIEAQRGELLEAERQRVMLESLGAACHHLGQPATVIKGYLEFMQMQEKSEEQKAIIKECLQAADSIADVLERLQAVSIYRTEPYFTPKDGDEERILKI